MPAGSAAQMELLNTAVEVTGHAEVASIGVDVAAEHLVAAPSRYRLGDDQLTSGELAEWLAAQAQWQADAELLPQPRHRL